MLKVHPDRPLLEPSMAPEALDAYYWYMQELVTYCREQGLSTHGHKHEVLESVRDHLCGSLVMTPRESARAKATRAATGDHTITFETRIGPDYKCDANTRAFFESVIGPHFHFTAHLQRFRRANTHRQLTYGDLATEWIAEHERRKDKSYKSTLMHTWEYNRFVRDYMRDKERNHGKTLKDAAVAWNELRQSCGPRDYASSIAARNAEGSRAAHLYRDPQA
ncbi:MAG: DUF6434 domain-containing protein [Alphaproteobacteria bacterium]|nr:DUF6434 domain-containing protein [Alphaproteobacteria bacterium]